MGKRITKEEFIMRAIAEHGDKYGYGRIEYVNTSTKVAIYCKVHKTLFMQSPAVHMKGSGCPLCNGGARLTTETFIEKARKIHSDAYDYSSVDYKTSTSDVKIYCRKHKIYFMQTPNSHLHGHGCPDCAKENRAVKRTISQDYFLMKAKEVHGDKYDYSETICRGATKPVRIFCKRHQEFFTQQARNHLMGYGCSRCGHEKRAAERKMTTAEYIARAKEVHGDKYLYNNTVYSGAGKKVVVTCPKHGDWWTRPIPFLEGHGCPRCNGGIRYTAERFIQQAKSVHGDLYDYSRVKYVNNRNNVKIWCKKHKTYFLQWPLAHLAGNGCPACGRERTAEKLAWTTAKFITEAEKVHGVGIYDYSMVKYVGCYDKILIGCKKHGEWFYQSPTKHLSGQGCPICSTSGFDIGKPAILYYLRVNHRENVYYKIGITNKSVKERYCNRDMRTITTLKTWDHAVGKEAYNKEQAILRQFKGLLAGVTGVLKSGGDSELFSVDVLGLDRGKQS